MALAIFLGLAAYVLIYSGFKGANPLDTLTSAFTGEEVKQTLSSKGVSTASPQGHEALSGIGGVAANVTRSHAFFNDAASRFPYVANLGVLVIKKISGSSVWSQHSYGNAVDIGVANMAVGDDVAAWAKRQAGVRNVLWRVPDHFDHVHVDFEPPWCGSPYSDPHPCGSGESPGQG